jgi:hypothetical protein
MLMPKWLNDLNNFGRTFWYAAGAFATAVGSYNLFRAGSTLLGGVLALVTIGAGLTIIVRTRSGAFD